MRYFARSVSPADGCSESQGNLFHFPIGDGAAFPGEISNRVETLPLCWTNEAKRYKKKSCCVTNRMHELSARKHGALKGPEPRGS